MKIQWRVSHVISGSLCVAFSLFVVGCHEFKANTAHYGHGSYRCYYQNDQTGRLFEGVQGDREKATSIAKKDCRVASKKDEEKMQCRFVDCLFR